MTRKLPWKQAGGSSASVPSPARSTPSRQQKVKRDASDVDDDQPAGLPSPAKRIKSSNSAAGSPAPNRIVRRGSTSPAPEPLPESDMIEGLEHDDLYRMVEDEFLSTAQQFTAHLHAAEYHRLKAASKSQNADTIRNISRPVVGRMTDLVKQKQERKARLEKQKAAARRAMANKGHNDDSTASESDPWHTVSLHGLMESPRKKAARLDNLTKVATTTRAAAGFSTAKPRQLFSTSNTTRGDLPGSRSILKSIPKGADETEDDGDDDLARSSTKTHPSSIRKVASSPSQPPKQRQISSIPRNNQPSLHSERRIHPILQKADRETTTQADSSSDESGGDFLSRLKQRQEDRRRNRAQRNLGSSSKMQSKQAPTDDIIPGFL